MLNFGFQVWFTIFFKFFSFCWPFRAHCSYKLRFSVSMPSYGQQIHQAIKFFAYLFFLSWQIYFSYFASGHPVGIFPLCNNVRPFEFQWCANWIHKHKFVDFVFQRTRDARQATEHGLVRKKFKLQFMDFKTRILTTTFSLW